MTVIDTSLVIQRIKNREPINDNVTVITVVEYPTILEYTLFSGAVIYSKDSESDYNLAIEIQRKLRKAGLSKGASDLLIAAICINNNEALKTLDSDFKDIAKFSSLKLSSEI